MEEISREYYLAHAGHKATAELQPIYEAYESILGAGRAGARRCEAFRAAPTDSEEQAIGAAAARLAGRVAERREPLAELDEREIAWENSAVIRSPDGRVDPVPGARRSRSRTPRDRASALALEPRARSSWRRSSRRCGASGSSARRTSSSRSSVAADYNATFER